MSKWNDQFDFDDFDSKPKKGRLTKETNKKTDDFFDMEEPVSSKVTKLPLINTKTPQSSVKNQKKTKKSYDDQEQIQQDVQEIKSPKGKTSENKKQVAAYQEIEDITAIKHNNSLHKKHQDHSQVSEDENYFQEVEEIPSKSPLKLGQEPKNKSNLIKRSEEEKEEDYQQHFDEYGEDLNEQKQQQKQAAIPKKSITSVNLKEKSKDLKEQNKAESNKYSINTNKIFTNKQTKSSEPLPKELQKEKREQLGSKKLIQAKATPIHGLSQPPKQLIKSNSRKSLKSNDSKSNVAQSRVSKNTVAPFIVNKHMNLVEKNFPDQDQKLNSMSIDRLSKINDQARELIRKFNDELNDLINKNLILLSQKPKQKQKTVDDRIRLLQQQIKNGANTIQAIENDYERLKGRQGQLKQEQYQIIMDKKIAECKQQTKEAAKAITKLKFEMNNHGNKLSNQQVQKKMAQQLHQIKIMLVQAKKEDEKNQTKLEKLEKMIEELDTKNNEKEYELGQQIDAAKQKGIVFGIKQETRKKYDELKLKAITADNHRKCIEGLLKNKCEHIVHQNQQIKITIKSIQSQLTHLAHQIEHEQEQSIKIIKKAKQNAKNSATFAQNLDKLLNSIQYNQNINLFDVRAEGVKSQASQRPLKTSMYQNMAKEKPTRNSTSSKEQTAPRTEPNSHPDEINVMKPNFSKKKQKNSDMLHKQDQKSNRVWNQDEEQKKREEEQRKKELKKIKEQQAKKEEISKIANAALQEQKKKPFNLKKNRLNQEKFLQQTPQKTTQVNHPLPKIQEPEENEKKQEKQSLGPKMKFNKMQKSNSDHSKNQITHQNSKEETKIAKQQASKQVIESKANSADPQQPIFAPKRFNLRNKLEKKEQSYIPTLQNKIEEKKEEKADYTSPNFSLKNEDSSRRAVQEGKGQNEIKPQALQQKPRFTLRLRDRQKKESNQLEYLPNRMTEAAEEKVAKNQIDSNIVQILKKQEEKPLNINNKNEVKSFQTSAKAVIKEIDKHKDLQNSGQSKQPQIMNKDTNHYATKLEVQTAILRQKQAVSVQANNPYAPKEDLPKRERQGPVKKIKIQNKQPKQKFNIYEQAEDITQQVSQPTEIPAAQPLDQKPSNTVPMTKTSELDLNAMLGIKKKEKSNDLDDLLGQIKIDKKKDRKKNADFFHDLEL